MSVRSGQPTVPWPRQNGGRLAARLEGASHRQGRISPEQLSIGRGARARNPRSGVSHALGGSSPKGRGPRSAARRALAARPSLVWPEAAVSALTGDDRCRKKPSYSLGPCRGSSRSLAIVARCSAGQGQALRGPLLISSLSITTVEFVERNLVLQVKQGSGSPVTNYKVVAGARNHLNLQLRNLLSASL